MFLEGVPKVLKNEVWPFLLVWFQLVLKEEIVNCEQREKREECKEKGRKRRELVP